MKVRSWEWSPSEPQVTTALGEPVGLGPACPVAQGVPSASGALGDVVGARERGLAALACVGHVGALYSLGCPRRGARKEPRTRK